MSILTVFSIIYSLLDFFGGSYLSKSVVFESLESKTGSGAAVFNEISLKSSHEKDIWQMKQSHHGIHAKDWDEVKIIVNKDTTPFKASYHQIKNGKEVEFKTSCFRCHPSGPRFIRPNYASMDVVLDTKSRLTILKWNMLIKSYGDVAHIENKSVKREINFFNNKEDVSKHLKVKSCYQCHRSGGPRSILTAENIETIKFLLKNKAMPPWPYKITKEDQKEINRFIFGF